MGGRTTARLIYGKLVSDLDERFQPANGEDWEDAEEVLYAVDVDCKYPNLGIFRGYDGSELNNELVGYNLITVELEDVQSVLKFDGTSFQLIKTELIPYCKEVDEILGAGCTLHMMPSYL